MLINSASHLLSYFRRPSTLTALAYGATSFSITMLHSIFMLYYVDLYVNVYRLDDSWFYFGQAVFMVWNAVNDPLFGWISDNMHGQRYC